MRTTVAEVLLAAIMLAHTALNHAHRRRERSARRRHLTEAPDSEKPRDR